MADPISLFVTTCFSVQLILKLYHWNTTSYARHKVSDDLIKKISDSVDNFVETFIGIYKSKPVVNNISIDKKWLSETGIIECLQQFNGHLIKMEESFNIKNKELLTIRDDIVNAINKTLYLFTLE